MLLRLGRRAPGALSLLQRFLALARLFLAAARPLQVEQREAERLALAGLQVRLVPGAFQRALHGLALAFRERAWRLHLGRSGLQPGDAILSGPHPIRSLRGVLDDALAVPGRERQRGLGLGLALGLPRAGELRARRRRSAGTWPVLAGEAPRPPRQGCLQEAGRPAGFPVDANGLVASGMEPHRAGARRIDDRGDLAPPLADRFPPDQQAHGTVGVVHAIPGLADRPGGGQDVHVRLHLAVAVHDGVGRMAALRPVVDDGLGAGRALLGRGVGRQLECLRDEHPLRLVALGDAGRGLDHFRRPQHRLVVARLVLDLAGFPVALSGLRQLLPGAGRFHPGRLPFVHPGTPRGLAGVLGALLQSGNFFRFDRAVLALAAGVVHGAAGAGPALAADLHGAEFQMECAGENLHELAHLVGSVNVAHAGRFVVSEERARADICHWFAFFRNKLYMVGAQLTINYLSSHHI